MTSHIMHRSDQVCTRSGPIYAPVRPCHYAPVRIMHFPENMSPILSKKLCTSPRPHYAPVRNYAVSVPNYALPRPIMHFPGGEVHNFDKLCTRIGPISGEGEITQ